MQHDKVLRSLAGQRARHLRKAAADERLARASRPTLQSPTRPVRRAIGRSMVRLGTRLAAEEGSLPSLARSR